MGYKPLRLLFSLDLRPHRCNRCFHLGGKGESLHFLISTSAKKQKKNRHAPPSEAIPSFLIWIPLFEREMTKIMNVPVVLLTQPRGNVDGSIQRGKKRAVRKKRRRKKNTVGCNTHTGEFLCERRDFVGVGRDRSRRCKRHAPDFAARHLSAFSWLVICILRNGWRCDCQQGHKSNSETIPEPWGEGGENLEPWLK